MNTLEEYCVYLHDLICLISKESVWSLVKKSPDLLAKLDDLSEQANSLSMEIFKEESNERRVG